MTNMFSQLGEKKTPKIAPRNIPEIILKVIDNCNLILKEICQQFPKTENRLRKDFIGIRADTEENRERIINFFKEKKVEFVPNESFEDRPMKVVI
ncbi:hypothetical protein AVEN_148413-1 [Araneus ventricosus]|uniref:Uncharacterized protein n=1 Tax=Araneus ventricosus TaxID=182803 RepID=A0A4Y2WDG2_ARAVE|nr:hypothetical protein AVEN_148413-1 [Araneus ventricosus]